MVKINGENLAVAGQALAEHLASAGYDRKRIVVERNGKIIPPGQYEEVILKDGDILEIVSFVGGG